MSGRLPVIEPDRQVAFFLRLEEIRNLYLGDALSEAVLSVELSQVDVELQRFVDKAALSKVASSGLRGEVFFPVPTLLSTRPMLLGYYRLLFGVSQKFFYRGGAFGSFKAMEDRGVLSNKAAERVPELCESLCLTGQMLVERLDSLSLSMVHELQLLTLGPQFKGGENNVVGEEAVKDFSALLESLVRGYMIQRTSSSLTMKNTSGRTVFIRFGSDPDVDISEITQTGPIRLVAIEVKGGRDNANKHNRLGEAEKSHLTAKQTGHTRFWTVAMVDYEPADVAKKSPTTQELWRLDRIKDPTSAEGSRFRDMLASVLGLSDA